MACECHVTYEHVVMLIFYIKLSLYSQMLSEAIMHECVFRLLRSHSDVESLECFARLITTTGKDLDHPQAKVRGEGGGGRRKGGRRWREKECRGGGSEKGRKRLEKGEGERERREREEGERVGKTRKLRAR